MERLTKMLGKRKRGKAGFTLVELMIVIIIVGVLAAAAVPIYTGYVKKAYIAEAKATIGTIRSAEMVYKAEHGEYLAINETADTANGRLHTLAVDVSGNTWWKGANVTFSTTANTAGTPPTTDLTTIVAVAGSGADSKIAGITVTLTVATGVWTVTP